MAVFNVTSKATGETQLEVTARQFKFVVDEPPALGGEDQGPNPVEYVLGALLGCFNVVIHIVAKERGVTINSLTLDAEGDLDPSKVVGAPTENRAGYSDIRVTVRLDSDADDATVQSIIDEAKTRCPVSDNLANPTPVSFAFERA